MVAISSRFAFISDFNPRSRVGSDYNKFAVKFQVMISIHAPAWGATNVEYVKFMGNVISIHAPAWGATQGLHLLKRVCPISIHAPAWGATIFPGLKMENIIFQSTLPRGERRSIWIRLIWGRPISIHAPAWGATQRDLSTPCLTRNFNPRSRVGSDQDPERSLETAKDFNPRSRVGSDWCTPPCLHRPTYFNPRSRVGSDIVRRRYN